MASDNLNQVGKYINETKEEANYAIKKKRPNRPSVERTRDIFDPDVSFTTKFTVQPKQKRVTLTLEFNKPPPMSECLGSSRSSCQTFDGLSGGDHELQVDNSYVSGTASVYVNGAVYSSSKWGEVNTTDGIFYVTQLPRTVNTVTICYLLS